MAASVNPPDPNCEFVSEGPKGGRRNGTAYTKACKSSKLCVNEEDLRDQRTVYRDGTQECTPWEEDIFATFYCPPGTKCASNKYVDVFVRTDKGEDCKDCKPGAECPDGYIG